MVIARGGAVWQERKFYKCHICGKKGVYENWIVDHIKTRCKYCKTSFYGDINDYYKYLDKKEE